MKKFGYFCGDCVQFVINKQNYRDYIKMDSTIRIENGKNIIDRIENRKDFIVVKIN